MRLLGRETVTKGKRVMAVGKVTGKVTEIEAGMVTRVVTVMEVGKKKAWGRWCRGG